MATILTATMRVSNWQALLQLSDGTLVAFARAFGARRYALYRNVYDAAEALLIVEGASVHALLPLRDAIVRLASAPFLSAVATAIDAPPTGELWEQAECLAIEGDIALPAIYSASSAGQLDVATARRHQRDYLAPQRVAPESITAIGRYFAMSASTRSELEQKVIERAWKDEQFRSALMSDPRATLEKEFQIGIPDDVTIEVIEERSNTLYFVLPPNPDAALSTEELDKVAGGLVRPVRGGDTSGEFTCEATSGCLVTPSSSGCSDCVC